MDMILTKNEIKNKIIKMTALVFSVLAFLLFTAAGTFLFWQVWVLMCCLGVSVYFLVAYFLKYDQELLLRRMQFHENEFQQKFIVKISTLFFIVGLIVAGLDFRFSLSNIPLVVVLISDLMILVGYRIVFLVFKENSYASRIIEVVKGQKVISTGPYSIVRHPMYVGVIFIYLFFPIALGSLWSFLFFLPIIPFMAWRIVNEEFLLRRDLFGYEEYIDKVKFRLIPHLW